MRSGWRRGEMLPRAANTDGEPTDFDPLWDLKPTIHCAEVAGICDDERRALWAPVSDWHVYRAEIQIEWQNARSFAQRRQWAQELERIAFILNL